jgi:hypothetical protein
MPKTANSYIPDQGEIAITISAANVSAIAAFTTAQEIVLDGALRAFRQVTPPSRTFEQTKVTGDTTPITTASKTKGAEEWEIVLVDDYSEGNAGEWGTDLLAAAEIFFELFDNDQHPGGLQLTPAGGATGDIEYTLVNPKILSITNPPNDADATTPAEVTIRVGCDKNTKAAHA